MAVMPAPFSHILHCLQAVWAPLIMGWKRFNYLDD